MTVSATIFFPIPFFYITMTPSFYVPLFTLLYVKLGKSSVNYISYIAIQKFMGMVYPAYQLLFHKAAATYFVLPVVLLQPVIKIAAKNIVLRFTKHLEDLTPEAVIFTVDFYNALYLVTFMESASTLNTMLILIGTDVSQTILVLLKVHRRTATVLPRLRLVTGAFADENLLQALCLLCRNQDKLATQINENVRVRSCLAHRLSPADNNLLFMLEKSAANAPHPTQCWPTLDRPIASNLKLLQTPDSPFRKLQRLLRRHTGSVRPTGSITKRSLCLQPSLLSVSRRESRTLSTARAQYSNILRETLEVLYTTECLVLTAYLEAFIPTFYCMYMLLMVHFPNAKYHTELENVTRQNVNYTVTVVALFGLLQVVSFGLLGLLLRRKCGMNALYQLAFVLETQTALVQGKLMIWVLVTLACRVVHFGTLRGTCRSSKLTAHCAQRRFVVVLQASTTPSDLHGSSENYIRKTFVF
jgi:hypothetical protein